MAWDDLKAELWSQFLLGNSSYAAMDTLLCLHHTEHTQVCNAYAAFMLEIDDMSDHDRLYHFLAGLQPWAQIELRRQGVKMLKATMATIEALVDLRVLLLRQDLGLF